MYQQKFTKIPRPVLVSSLRHRTVDEVIADIRLSEAQGAQAFLLHIQLLNEEYKNAEALKKIFDATDLPVMAINYRTEGQRDDEKLTALLLDAVRVGAAAIDLPLDTFDCHAQKSLKLTDLPFAAANPKQVSMLESAVARQKDLIAQVHDLGAEVLLSAHVETPLTAAQGVSLAAEMQSRGADIVKIITWCNTHEQALEILHTDALLDKKLSVPYLYQCGGAYGALVRLIAPLFGSSLVLCHAEYGELSNCEKPLLTDVKKVHDGIKWRLWKQ